MSDTVLPQMESAAHLRRRYHDVELVISCGDMPAVYLEFITSVLNVPLFYVRGNHDTRYTEYPPGGEDLHGRRVTYGGLTFAGLEGSMRYNRSPVQYNEFDMLMMVLRMWPLRMQQMRRGYGLDVLVTHSPARGIHDMPDLPHTGFKALLRFMEWYRPRYMFHGHVHTWDRRVITESTYLDTCIMNINPATVIEVEPR
ncbi:MAG: metallophosphoesterase [Chloroflexi bacterium]|nr:metallophosphoesterase [Chloroflexota bacterium]